ncbi:MAG: GNAT family N-acetyltransferase [Casimicrobiaceae bacterium]
MPSDAVRIAQVLIDVRSRFMPYAPAAHSDDEIRSWVSTVLLSSSDVIVANINGEFVGVLATAQESGCSWIRQMAVDPDSVGRGIGSALVRYALRVLAPPIRLYTFQANDGARRFYERYGFRAIRFSDGHANEERCPDVLYEFSSSRGGGACSSTPRVSSGAGA